MDKILFLTMEEAVVIHEKMIEIGGGSPGILDLELLHSAIERPKAMFGGEYLYQSILDMGSAMLQSLVKNHPFVDGKKRTAFFSTLRFLERNDQRFSLQSSDIVNFMVRVDTEDLKVTEISKWFEKSLV